MCTVPASTLPAMSTGKPVHIRHVHWTAFRVDPNLHAQWLQDPTSLPVSTAVHQDEHEACSRHLSSMLALHDGILDILRRRIRRNESKISRAVDRGATSGGLDRLKRKAAKLHYRMEEVRDDKRRLLEISGHECLHPTSIASLVPVSCAPRAKSPSAAIPHEVWSTKD